MNAGQQQTQQPGWDYVLILQTQGQKLKLVSQPLSWQPGLVHSSVGTDLLVSSLVNVTRRCNTVVQLATMFVSRSEAKI